MRATKVGAGDRAIARNDGHVAGDVRETVTGSPMEKLDLMEILSRSTRGVTRGGAISGAAHMTANRKSGSRVQLGEVALSDGSRISFASIEHDDAP